MFKRHLLLFALAALLLLSACGKTTDTSNPSVVPDPSPATTSPASAEPADTEASKQPAESEPQGETRTVTHMRGDSLVPNKIERTVVLSAAYIDYLFTIDEKPVGVNTEARYGGDYLPYLADKLEGVQVVGSAESPDLELILTLDPDIILVEGRTPDEIYQNLNKIAPTIVIGGEWMEYEESWSSELMQIAALFGKEELAQQQLDALEVKIADAKAKIDKLTDKKLAYLRVRDGVVQIYAQKGHPMNTLLYNDLGFEPASLTPEENRSDLSLELIPDLDADFIMLEVDPNGREYLEQMTASPLWSKVPAVSKQQVYETDSFWLFKGWGVIGRGEIINEILSQIK